LACFKRFLFFFKKIKKGKTFLEILFSEGVSKFIVLKTTMIIYESCPTQISHVVIADASGAVVPRQLHL
jgi:hypothetical protein